MAESTCSEAGMYHLLGCRGRSLKPEARELLVSSGSPEMPPASVLVSVSVRCVAKTENILLYLTLTETGKVTMKSLKNQISLPQRENLVVLSGEGEAGVISFFLALYK